MLAESIFSPWTFLGNKRCVLCRFGAALPDDPDTAELAKLSSMGERNDKWMQVQDFGWLKSSASPNW